jgi:parallel beta-helix repeat protein
MRSGILIFLGLFAGALAAHAEVLDCNAEMKAKVLAPAKMESKNIVLDCHLHLSASDVVTKQLVFRGAASSGVTLDCNGATLKAAPGEDAGVRITVTSSPPDKKSSDEKWTPAENIQVRNCVIEGSVRVRGMASNGEDKTLTESSRREGHSQRVRANAPSGIVFERNQFIGQGAIPIYFAPGVHDSMILNSRIGGFSNSVALYLDAESGDNTIKGNHIDTETTLKQSSSGKARKLLFSIYNQAKGETNASSLTGRELIAIDGSARNRIVNNRFSNLDNGGIFLYRNCGEGGNIRHQAPQANQIVNNVFYYDKFDGDIPAIWLGSRNGNRAYCDLDKGYPFGSSLSDRDDASGNFVAQNQFYKFKPSKIMRDNGEGNVLEDNSRIEPQPIARKAGCMVKEGKRIRLLADNAAIQVQSDPLLSACSMQEQRCDDGIVSMRTTPCIATKP